MSGDLTKDPQDLLATLDALAASYEGVPADGDYHCFTIRKIDWLALRAELLAARESIDTLFDAVAHGDVEHRSWLKAEISRHFAAWRVARANGGGSGE